MDPELIDVPAASRYELRSGDTVLGRIDYRDRGDVRTMAHAEIDPAHGGTGLGRRMVRAALDDCRAHGRRVVPACPFVGHVVREEPAYADLVAG